MAVDLEPEDRALVNEVVAKFLQADAFHRKHARKWEHHYALYRNYQDFRNSTPGWHPNDKDQGLRDAKREWGAELFIPYVFSTIETIVPRMLAHRPRMLVLPRTEESEQNVENMKFLVEAQQEQINYELICQDTAKTGCMYGLGIQKTGWKKRYRKTRRLPLDDYGQVLREVDNSVRPLEREVCTFDDPYAEDIDPFDFFWDPLAKDVETARFLIHRTWKDTQYVLDMMQRGVWRSDFLDLDEAEDVKGMASPQKYQEAWEGRRRAQGLSGTDLSVGDLHEVWEFHDGDRVVTILNRELPVQNGRNPHWHGEMPFHIFRPTRIPKEFVGIGVVEPMESLQQEMNTMRSQRRDNATLVLQRPFFYQDGMLDAADIAWGPAVGIPTVGEPSSVLHFPQIPDIPNSSYQEEEGLRGDLARVSGLDDQMAGVQGVTQTATEAQLIQANASVRVQNAVRLFEAETIKSASKAFVALNQQHIRENRDLPIPAEPQPGDEERRWAWIQVGPKELAGEFVINPEGGSTVPDNTPQDRQDAQTFMGLLQDPAFEPRLMRLEVLRKMGVKQPEAYLAPSQPQYDEETVLGVLQGLGAQPEQLEAMRMALAQAKQMQESGEVPEPEPEPVEEEIIPERDEQGLMTRARIRQVGQ